MDAQRRHPPPTERTRARLILSRLILLCVGLSLCFGLSCLGCDAGGGAPPPDAPTPLDVLIDASPRDAALDAAVDAAPPDADPDAAPLDAVVDARPLDLGPDAAPLDALIDALPPDALIDAAPSCARLEGPRRRVCADEEAWCGVVFEDGAGCDATCAAAGLTCLSAWEPRRGACAPALARPWLPCDTRPRRRAYCVCGPGGAEHPPGFDEIHPEGGCYAPPAPPLGFEVVGFGAGTVGGSQPEGRLCLITSAGDDGPGTLRQRLREAVGMPHVLRFAEDMTIQTRRPLDLPSKVTLDGRGRRVTITGQGFRVDDASQIAVINLALVNIDGPGDGFQILNRSHHVAIDHCRFENPDLIFTDEDEAGPDEQISIVFGATDVTISNSYFAHHDKVLLFGDGDAPPELDAQIRVTLRRNVFDGTSRRHPFLRYGRVDMFNNVVREWTMRLPGRFPYGARASTGAQILLEANLFERSAPGMSFAAWVEDGGRLRAIDNVHGDLPIIEGRPEAVFHRPYPARVAPMTRALRERLLREAGDTLHEAR